MCEFCVQHGEGKTWYLAMQNYSRELYAQQGRADFTEDCVVRFEEVIGNAVAQFDVVKEVPLVNRLARVMSIRREKALHWGQVVPIEDVDQIIDMQDSIVRFSCSCRRLTTGREARYCFGLGVDVKGILGKYPDYSYNLETLGKEEAKHALRSLDNEGMVHTIWTFKTPFIGSICNCDQDCMAYRIQVKRNMSQLMFRAEYVALVDWDECNGCKKCLMNCQFGAIDYLNSVNRAVIDAERCYGCGVCRAACAQDAITLKPRTEFVGLPW